MITQSNQHPSAVAYYGGPLDGSAQEANKCFANSDILLPQPGAIYRRTPHLRENGRVRIFAYAGTEGALNLTPNTNTP